MQAAGRRAERARAERARTKGRSGAWQPYCCAGRPPTSEEDAGAEERFELVVPRRCYDDPGRVRTHVRPVREVARVPQRSVDAEPVGEPVLREDGADEH